MRIARRNATPTQPTDWLAALRTVAFAALFSATCIGASAQSEAAPVPLTALPDQRATLDLPDAPGAIGTVSSTSASESSPGQNIATALSPPGPGTASLPEASHSQRYPLPGQPAPVLTAGEKVRMGFTGALSFYSVVGWVASAGYEQAVNGSPNFGTDRGAFGQRLWTSAARATSENLLADSVFAPLFHEDPRYYRLGSSHKVLPRLVYAATRVLITRSDSGSTVPNLSQIFGNAAGSALTYAYYPQSNRTAKDTAETFGGSLGGTALGDAIAEFFGGILFSHSH